MVTINSPMAREISFQVFFFPPVVGKTEDRLNKKVSTFSLFILCKNEILIIIRCSTKLNSNTVNKNTILVL